MNLLNRNTIHIDRAKVCSEGKCLLNQISAKLRPGRLVGVIGPNGAGKSVLFRALTGESQLESGSIRLGGFSLNHWPAKKISMFVASAPDVSFESSPSDLVGQLAPDAKARDLAAIDPLRYRSHGSLSCPERRRVQLGRALGRAINEASLRYLWLDEPDADLDLAHRLALMQALRGLAGRGLGILCVLRHIELAEAFPDEVIVLCDGCVLRQGPPRQILSAEIVRVASGFSAPVLVPPPAVSHAA